MNIDEFEKDLTEFEAQLDNLDKEAQKGLDELAELLASLKDLEEEE